jgi:hypothetical protein
LTESIKWVSLGSNEIGLSWGGLLFVVVMLLMVLGVLL